MIPNKYPNVSIDNFVIMPNHLHLIVVISAPLSGTGDPSPTISNIIGWFKYQTTKHINELQNTIGKHIWQRSYHDHIIRSEKSYQQIWQYIDANPQMWEKDSLYTDETI